MISPALHTQRLTLRAPVFGDFPAYAAFMATDRAMGIGGPYDTRGAWALFCHDTAGWPLFGLGALMVETAAGEVVGQVGLNAGPLFPEHELGWMIYAGHARKGYAKEAAIALRDWALGPRGLATLVSYIDPDNVASIAVAERLDARIDAAAVPMDAGDLVYRHRGPV